MDTMTREQRSNCMRAIKGRDTLPEVIVRKWLYSQGYRFRCQYKKVPGHPDVAIPKHRTLIEIRGCFWHRHGWKRAAVDSRSCRSEANLVQEEYCALATMPKTNKSFWRNKFKANVERDARHEREWAELGWNVIIIWECGLKTVKDRERTFRRLGKWLREFTGPLSAPIRGTSL